MVGLKLNHVGKKGIREYNYRLQIRIFMLLACPNNFWTNDRNMVLENASPTERITNRVIITVFPLSSL